MNIETQGRKAALDALVAIFRTLQQVGVAQAFLKQNMVYQELSVDERSDFEYAMGEIESGYNELMEVLRDAGRIISRDNTASSSRDVIPGVPDNSGSVIFPPNNNEGSNGQ